MATVTAPALKSAKRDALLNGKYHAERESFFSSWMDWITFGLLVTGAMAFFELFGEIVQRAGAGALTLLALALVVFKFPEKARLHSELKQQYFDIASKLESSQQSPAHAQAEMLKISGREPPPYCALHALSENWATTAVYGMKRKSPCQVSGWQKFTRHFLRHDSAEF